MANSVEISILLDLYGETLTEKQRSYLDCYYNNDLSLSEIAENEGITRQGVRDEKLFFTEWKKSFIFRSVSVKLRKAQMR